ncbi:helix-turn-helix domain-containing protein [Halodesulfurarchaeum sp. HSR-GB]|uniref:helix-turn-helix domain-containing protein n=1 Tax=Halodesulfurarchaeum sp. HSR-GB TaxID=3074077 RepID=UPI00285476A1|nr:helix-turn-helix domain-containing protein [Halodesulfurarchaeum sp. HSR-GB]MDR5656569.1 helix-turn-helix domain-containing protein [Halodesulfurarchaeum sp. HSR-GB]
MTRFTQVPEPEERELRVVIQVQPKTGCPLVEFEGRSETLKSQLSGDICHCEAIVEDADTRVEHTTKDVSDPCVCSVFHENACVADITDAGERGLTITTYVRDRTVLEELIEDLNNVGDSVRLVEITSNYDGNIDKRVEQVDLSSLTEKQRSAAKLAIEMGYYQRPRETSLEEMAAELDISQQALSQRLGAVEEKLITQLFTDA